MMDWHNNEDAGDLRMMGLADYDGEMNEQREHEQREQFTREFDEATYYTEVRPGYFEVSPAVSAVAGRPFVPQKFGRVLHRVHGPAEAPFCEECWERLERHSDGRYHRGDGLFVHRTCWDGYVAGRGSSWEGREFPTYG